MVFDSESRAHRVATGPTEPLVQGRDLLGHRLARRSAVVKERVAVAPAVRGTIESRDTREPKGASGTAMQSLIWSILRFFGGMRFFMFFVFSDIENGPRNPAEQKLLLLSTCVGATLAVAATGDPWAPAGPL